MIIYIFLAYLWDDANRSLNNVEYKYGFASVFSFSYQLKFVELVCLVRNFILLKMNRFVFVFLSVTCTFSGTVVSSVERAGSLVENSDYLIR